MVWIGWILGIGVGLLAIWGIIMLALGAGDAKASARHVRGHGDLPDRIIRDEELPPRTGTEG